MSGSNSGLHRGLLVLALTLGVLGDALLRAVPWGVNLFVWALSGVAGVVLLGRREARPLPVATLAWMAVALLCALFFSFRDTRMLNPFAVLAGAGALALAAWTARGGSPFAAGLFEYASQGLLTSVHAGLGAFGWLRSALLGPRRAPQETGASWPWLRALLGALVASPVLLVFGALFASADPVFAKALGRLVTLDFETLVQHAFLIGFWGWISAGYLWWTLSGSPSPAGSVALPSPPRAPVIEVLVGLGLLTALFLTFVLVQVRYLFGSDGLVQATLGMTYAEYARRGFFELVGVGLLLIPLLLGCDWLLGAARQRRGFQSLAAALLALLALILISAWKRLGLYTAAYGLTESRVGAAVVLIWIAFLVGWFPATVLSGRRPRFAGGAVVAALVLLGGLAAWNPDASIARTQLARAHAGLDCDVDHLLSLGPDAVPVLLGNLAVLSESDQAKVRSTLSHRWGSPAPDWRPWNLARARARAAVAALSDAPQAEATP